MATLSAETKIQILMAKLPTRESSLPADADIHNYRTPFSLLPITMSHYIKAGLFI
jgi:hypothetical protein